MKQQLENTLSKKVQLNKLLSDSINALKEEYDEQLMQYIINVTKQQDSKKKEQAIKKLIDFIYNGLEKSYSTSLSFFRYHKWLHKIPSQKFDINTLTFNQDGKTVEDRIQLYLKQSDVKLKNKINNLDVNIYLFNMLSRILNNEMDTIRWNLYRQRCQTSPYIAIIAVETCDPNNELPHDHWPLENCDVACHIWNHAAWKEKGIYGPPFHPGCSCELLTLTEEEIEILQQVFPNTPLEYIKFVLHYNKQQQPYITLELIPKNERPKYIW